MVKNFSDQEIIINGEKSIFLAGPTLRDSEFYKSWRKVACDILEELNFKGIVYIPEFSNGKNPFEFDKQVDWERAGLMHADIICFYVPRRFPDLPGFTTNVEFGFYLAKRPDNVMLCCPEYSSKNQYLKWLFVKEKPDDYIYTELKELLIDAVKKLN